MSHAQKLIAIDFTFIISLDKLVLNIWLKKMGLILPLHGYNNYTTSPHMGWTLHTGPHPM
jgi:hypothetical protein